MASCSYDFDLKLWDFNGMNRVGRKPFRTLEPLVAHQLHGCEWNTTGDNLLVIPTDAQAKVYNREGDQLAQYIRGDPYLRDMKLTKGHTADINAGHWDKVDANTFYTCSSDSTVRIWDAEVKSSHKSIIIIKSPPGKRLKATTCMPSPDGKQIAVALSDGSIQIWNTKQPYIRPASAIINAHLPLTETSGLNFNSDGRFLVSRGGDDTVKIWDLRQTKKPFAEKRDVESSHPEQNAIFSPDNRSILVGVGAAPTENGHLLILSSSDLSVEQDLELGPGSSICTVWNEKINQIAVSQAGGSIRLLYSPILSKRGARLVMSKAPKTQHIDDDSTYTTNVELSGISINELGKGGANADEIAKRRERSAARKDPIRSHRPYLPSSALAKDPEALANKDAAMANVREEDPREALLKYAEIAKKDPMFTKAYSKTQPNP